MADTSRIRPATRLILFSQSIWISSSPQPVLSGRRGGKMGEVGSRIMLARSGGLESLLRGSGSWYFDVGQGLFIHLIFDSARIALANLLLVREQGARLDRAACERTLRNRAGLMPKRALAQVQLGRVFTLNVAFCVLLEATEDLLATAVIVMLARESPVRKEKQLILAKCTSTPGLSRRTRPTPSLRRSSSPSVAC